MTDETPYVSITRTFAASPEEVFEAWTAQRNSAAGSARSPPPWRTSGWTCASGGEWSARMILGEGVEIGWHGSYLEVDAPNRLVLSLSDRPGDQFERVTVALTKVDGGTEMTFTQSGSHVPPENYARLEEGWRSFFDDLSKGLAG